MGRGRGCSNPGFAKQNKTKTNRNSLPLKSGSSVLGFPGRIREGEGRGRADKRDVMCSCVPRHTQVSTKGAKLHSLHACLPGMPQFKGQAQFLSSHIWAGPCWSHQQSGFVRGHPGAISTPGKIQRLGLWGKIRSMFLLGIPL